MTRYHKIVTWIWGIATLLLLGVGLYMYAFNNGEGVLLYFVCAFLTGLQFAVRKFFIGRRMQ